MGRNARCHAFTRLNRHCERGFVTGRIIRAHQIQTQIIHPIRCHRQTNQSASMGCHEIDRIRGRHLRRDHQIAFVFAIFMIDQNEHFAVTCGIQNILDWGDDVAMRRLDQTWFIIIHGQLLIRLPTPIHVFRRCSSVTAPHAHRNASI